MLHQQRSSCFPVRFVGFPIAPLSFVCLSHGGGRLSPFWQVQSKVVDSRLVSISDRETLPWYSLPITNSSHPRATSHCPNNRISKPAHRRSQPLHWTSHRMDRFSTGPLGTTRSRLLWMPWVSTSLLGTMRHHLQGTILTLTSSSTLRRSDARRTSST